eukprot:GHVN01009425.1.p1 GENE.GHVN01009425.1~~GHVN01009425.1.p1  ORF type:complete len:182 (-),score=3.84 GHVN01009425.1:869-1414(-)
MSPTDRSHQIQQIGLPLPCQEAIILKGGLIKTIFINPDLYRGISMNLSPSLHIREALTLSPAHPSLLVAREASSTPLPPYALAFARFLRSRGIEAANSQRLAILAYWQQRVEGLRSQCQDEVSNLDPTVAFHAKRFHLPLLHELLLTVGLKSSVLSVLERALQLSAALESPAIHQSRLNDH